MVDMPTVALLGTGIMGAGMARNILAAGLPLRVWNRSAEKARPLADAGAVVADDPADAVRGADVVVTMLGDGDHVADVLDQAADGFCRRPGAGCRRPPRASTRTRSSPVPTRTACCSSTRRCSAPASPPSRGSC